MLGATVGLPGPAASLEPETATLAPRPKQLTAVALKLTCDEPAGPPIRRRWPTARAAAAITPTASHMCSPRRASYQTSGRYHTVPRVVGHGTLIQGQGGLSHAEHGPVTEIYYVP